MTTLTDEQKTKIRERVENALQSVRRSDWPDTAKPVFGVLQEDIPLLLAALEAAEKRAETAEAAISGGLALNIESLTKENSSLRAEVERLREALSPFGEIAMYDIADFEPDTAKYNRSRLSVAEPITKGIIPLTQVR